MSELPCLPPGCRLRPATAADKPRIRQLLKNLERELSPTLTPPPRWIGSFGVAILIAGVGLSLLAPEARLLVQLAIVCVFGLTLLAIGATLLVQQQEWSHYWVIDYRGYLVACAKLQGGGHHSVLFDLYVVPDWRKQGVGSHLVSFLAQRAAKPLYLACLPTRQGFYERLGFATISPQRLSPLLQYDLGLPLRSGIIPMVLT